MKNKNACLEALKETVNNLSKGWKELWGPDNSPAAKSVIEKAPKEPVQEKEQNSLGNRFDQWWNKENAKQNRDSCHIYPPLIFRKPGDFDLAFKEALSIFWHTCGAVRIRREFPEIHVLFLTVNVYRLRDTWNRRDVDLKQALLIELRRGFVEFARSRGFIFDGWFDYVVTDVWKVNDMLVIEIPCSPFPFTYPQLVPVLEPEDYQRLKVYLNAKSEI